MFGPLAVHKVVQCGFWLQLVKHTASVRCLDLSTSRNKLAVVDENAAVLVFNLITKEKIFEVSGMPRPHEAPPMVSRVVSNQIEGLLSCHADLAQACPVLTMHGGQ